MARNFATKEGVEALCEWPIPLSRKCRGRWPIGTAPRKKCRHPVRRRRRIESVLP
ncbi:MAG: hypothetical protein LUD69_03435 [Oscillospiraceae bacterium]|nr:hypothetical protein [Oscillospiraceae bacterium]